MAYTVVSVFPQTVDTEEIKKDLREKGFNEADIIVSRSNVETGLDDYQEDAQTKGFFDYVFAHDAEMLNAYRTHSVGKSNVVVYADDLERAKLAKAVLDEKGALEVYRKPSDQQKDIPDGMTEQEYNGIIAKARHNIYFLDPERTYSPNSRGMEDTMDDLGSKD
ncbi:hypothetical protein SAMN05443633_102522 [Chryseobacterium arachidis]|uniref:Heat induced stress protein YflT n=1 Tax=Chryseobacterium arachidis TaxID=1416778 RepID=A0A1M4Y5Z8_9FLAO|nr:hypothetical protein [Chryseobacterium arachidis]SHF01181.1 hypothetical protein SAMN05443633_102522 [Chryseobacterium arachidis]